MIRLSELGFELSKAGSELEVLELVLLIHDLKGEAARNLLSLYPGKPLVVDDDGSIRHCAGCFGCWSQTPGICILKDRYAKNGAAIAKCQELHVVSACLYGGYSHFVKNVFDRSISFVHPFFELHQGGTRHKLRYERSPDLFVWFYGTDLSESEKKTARDLVAANALNFGCKQHSVSFVSRPQDIRLGGLKDAHSVN